MLKSIKVTNFYSIGKEQKLSFEINKSEMLDESSRTVFDKNINLVNSIIGANGSGKTTILKALSFILWFMHDSYRSMSIGEDIPVDSHQLNKNKPSQIEIEFFNEGRFFQYKIELNLKEVISEFLGEHIEKGYSQIFEYRRNQEDWNFKAPKLKINKEDLQRFREKKNVAVFSSLLATGYLNDFIFIKNVESNVTNMGMLNKHPFGSFLETSERFFKNKELKEDALSFVRDIDLGVSDFNFTVIERSVKDKLDAEKKEPALLCTHKSNVSSFELLLFNESNGTQRSLHMFSEISLILKTGGVYIVDEIESGLHPDVVKKIISLFESKETNPHHAQIIFSTHQHILLNDRTKTQIFIAEKGNEKFETEIYRLDDVNDVRNDENFFQKYKVGTYGGTPEINWLGA